MGNSARSQATPNPSLERTSTGMALGLRSAHCHHPLRRPSAIPVPARSAQTLGVMNNSEAWHSFFLHWTMVPLSIIWVYEAVRCIASRRWTKSPLLLGLLGTSFLLGYAASGGWAAMSLMKSLGEISQSTRPVELPESVLSSLPLAERAERSRLVAQINFTNLGVLTEHLLPDGTKSTYAPSQSEIQARTAEAGSMAEARAKLESVRTKSYAFALFAFVAIVAGFLRPKASAQRNDA